MAKRLYTAARKFVPHTLSETLFGGEGEFVPYLGHRLRKAHLVDLVDTFVGRYCMFKKQALNLHSEMLRQKYGTFYNYYIRYLLDKDVIVLDSNHQVGVKSITYRLQTRYKHEELAQVVVRAPVSKSAKVLAERNDSPIHEEVRAKLLDDLQHLTLDTGALDWLYARKGDMSPSKYSKNLYTMVKMHEGDRRCSFDKFGRMHTPVTVIKREVRKEFVRLDGKPTAEVDIGNSQPFFLYLILLEDGFDGWDGFDEDVINERLYDKMLAAGRFKSRDAAKRAVYRVLFGKSTSCVATNTFKLLYPAVWRKVCEIKLRAGNHAALAHQLQRAESAFLFNTAIKQLMAELPGVRMVTVHDSIIVASEHKSRVEALFETYQFELLQAVGRKAAAKKKALAIC